MRLVGLKATSHMRPRACDHYTSSTLIGGKGGGCPSLLEGPTEYVNASGCKVYMDSYMTSYGSCFMVTWTILKNHLLEVGLTQNHWQNALWMLTTIGSLYFIMVWGPAWMKNPVEIAFGWRVRSHMTSHDTRGSVTTPYDFGGVLGRPLGSHDFMITALGLCVKQCLKSIWT